jgi:hypothetical protein
MWSAFSAPPMRHRENATPSKTQDWSVYGEGSKLTQEVPMRARIAIQHR